MEDCSKTIAKCIKASCSNPVYSGIDATGWIFNKADVTPVYYQSDPQDDTTIDKHQVVSFTMATGKKGYEVQQLGKTPFTGTQTEMVEGTNANTFTNTLALVVPDNSLEVSKDIIDNLANGQFIVVLANSYEGGDSHSKYQVFGLSKGLTATAMTNDKYSEDTNGGWAVTLTEENVGVSGVFFYDGTSLTSTKSTLDGYIATC